MSDFYSVIISGGRAPIEPYRIAESIAKSFADTELVVTVSRDRVSGATERAKARWDTTPRLVLMNERGEEIIP